jgi:hypothetical protein
MAPFQIEKLMQSEIAPRQVAPDLKNSHSEIETYNRCERAHFYGYGLRIRAAKPGIQLVRGTLGHSALAEYYLGLKSGLSHKEAVRRAFSHLAVSLTEIESLYPGGKLREDLTFTLDAYFRHFESEAGEIEVLAVEQEFFVRVNDNYSLPFVIDLIVRTQSGIEAWDHKFVWDFFNPTLVDLSPQLPLYYAGLKLLGYPPLTVKYNELRYRVTKEARTDIGSRFNRVAPTLSPARVLTTVEEHIKVGERIYYLRQLGTDEWEKVVVRAKNNTACRNCDFSKICIGELNGESRTNYIGLDYVNREPSRT